MTKKIDVLLVVAVAENGVIGADGDMPWRLPTDLKRFKAVTMGKPIIMGRKTFESIGRALPGRLNIVITRQEEFAAEGGVVMPSIEAAIELAKANAADLGEDAICIIGGGQIYAETLKIADRLHVTHVAAAIEGDTHFPQIDEAIWKIEAEETPEQGEKDSHAIRFVMYQRK